MTHDEIRAAIAADANLLVLLPDTTAIAAALSEGRTRLVSRMANFGTVLDTLGPVDGAAVLDTLDSLRASVSAIKWAFVLLERNELDLGLASVRGQIDALTGTVFTTEQATALKALAEQPEDVSEYDVRCAIYNDDGALRV